MVVYFGRESKLGITHVMVIAALPSAEVEVLIVSTVQVFCSDVSNTASTSSSTLSDVWFNDTARVTLGSH